MPARRSFLRAMAGLTAMPSGARAASTPPLRLTEVAEGVHVHFGAIGLTTRENGGDIANLGVVVGRHAVAVVDTGGSVATGRALLAAVRSVTDLPVRFVVNTHEHPDHIFGNAAFAPDARFVGHAGLATELAARGDFYLRSFRGALGAEAIAEVRLIPPDLPVRGTARLDLGNRWLRLDAWSPAAHSGCDLTVLDERTGILFAGDLLFLQHVPVIDASARGWLALLPRLAGLPAKQAVPGHGQILAPWPQALDDERRYLETIIEDARRLIAAGVPLAQAAMRIGAAERERWSLFDDYNPRNATVTFSELEWE